MIATVGEEIGPEMKERSDRLELEDADGGQLLVTFKGGWVSKACEGMVSMRGGCAESVDGRVLAEEGTTCALLDDAVVERLFGEESADGRVNGAAVVAKEVVEDVFWNRLIVEGLGPVAGRVVRVLRLVVWVSRGARVVLDVVARGDVITMAAAGLLGIGLGGLGTGLAEVGTGKLVDIVPVEEIVGVRCGGGLGIGRGRSCLLGHDSSTRSVE